MTATGNQLSIAQMKPWHFWSSPWALELSLQDAAAIHDGSADAEQEKRGKVAALAAFSRLIAAPAGISRPS